MKYLFLMVLSLSFFVGNAQEKLSRKQRSEQYYIQGIENFDNKKYSEALALFVECRYNGDKNLFYYLAASAYYSNQPNSLIFKYIRKGVVKNDYKTISFYTVEIPIYEEGIDKLLFELTPGTSEEWALYNYWYANALAKKKDVNAFIYFEGALKSKFDIPLENHDNQIIKLDKERYAELLDKYNYSCFDHDIKNYVETKTLYWQKRGKFEKTNDYSSRVTATNREIKIKAFVQEYIDSIGIAEFGFKALENEYDADNEVYKLTFANEKFIVVPVSIKDAKSFDKNFSNLKYENATFTLTNNNFDLLHIEIVDEKTNKTFIYDSKEVLAFNASKLDLKFGQIELEDAKSFNYTSAVVKLNEAVDVDVNIPEIGVVKPNKFALIIGNEDYTSYQTGLSLEQNVAFAKNDAVVFREYCIKTLGIPGENIIFKTNAGVVQMHQSINQINSIIKNMNGEADVIFYYAGHGFPDKKTKVAHLIPVDVSSTTLDMAIDLNTVVDKFTQYPSKSVVMFLDACFTGGGRDMGLLASRGVKVVPNNTELKGNLVMFSASSIDQSALPFTKNNHGLFTYFLLKKLQETNGGATLIELDNYLKKEVSIKSTIIHSQEQNPKTYYSPQMQKKWQSCTL